MAQTTAKALSNGVEGTYTTSILSLMISNRRFPSQTRCSLFYTAIPSTPSFPRAAVSLVPVNLRVVKPGGIVSLSVHGDALKDRLLAHERREYEDTGLAVRAAWKPGGPWFTAYNSPRFMNHEFLAGHEIVRTEIHGENQKPPRQDNWVVRKPY